MISRLLRKTRKTLENEEGFTLIELLIVSIVSLIMVAGMVGLIAMGFQSFATGKNLQSLSDAARRALPAMDRQMKSLLHINDAECVASYQEATPAGTWNGTSFYADIDNDNTDATIDDYENAEKIEFYQDGDRLMQRTTQPASEGGAVTETSLCSHVDSVLFYYFSTGVAQGTVNPPANRYQGESLNSVAGSIKVVLTLGEGKLTRTYEQNTFLRILQRD